ncbi:MAG: hypothetical protein R2725_04205 [Solirubrobacterales bacterium]
MRDIRPRLALIAALCVALLGAVALGGGEAEAAKKRQAVPKAGKYAGKVGTFARMIFNVRGKLVLKLNAGVKTNCQRTSDGAITETKNLATAPSEQEPRAKLKLRKKQGRWIFSGKAQDKSGVEWKVSGRFVSRTKAKGTFEASKFESIYNPFQPFGFDGQLCAGHESWTAKLTR